MLEISTNYALGIPEDKDKLDEVLRGIKELFNLPDDAKSKLYPEAGIVERARDEYLIPSKSLFKPTI